MRATDDDLRVARCGMRSRRLRGPEAARGRAAAGRGGVRPRLSSDSAASRISADVGLAPGDTPRWPWRATLLGGKVVVVSEGATVRGSTPAALP